MDLGSAASKGVWFATGKPPSTGSATPVIQRAASDARKQTASPDIARQAGVGNRLQDLPSLLQIVSHAIS